MRIATHQSERFDEQCRSAEEVRDDVATKDRFDFGNTGVEGERCVNLHKERRCGCKNDLHSIVSFAAALKPSRTYGT